MSQPRTFTQSRSNHPQTSDGSAGRVTSSPAIGQLSVESHRICPGCGSELVDRGCKMRCPRCGFFLDCSDG
jgi:NADH pyrophosphatase NudC (nudix superfamily)